MFWNTYKSLHMWLVILTSIAIMVPISISHSEVFESWGTTDIKVVKLKYTWNINNFSFCKQKPGEFLYSPIFSSGTKNDNCEWKLSVYPNGIGEQYKNYVSLFLNAVSCNTRVEYKLGIVNAKQKKINVQNDTDQFVIGSGWGHNKFIERDFLFNEENEILLHDKFTVFCELNVTTEAESTSGVIPPSNQLQSSLLPNYLLKDLTFLFENQTFSDVTLSAGGLEYRALKVILATRSPVFKVMFENEFNVQETNGSRVEISDMDPEVLKEVLRYIYTEESPNLKRLALDLLVAADKYELIGLKLMCARYMSANLSVENAADYFVLGDIYSAFELKNQSRDFIAAHALEVTNSGALESMITTYPHLTKELFLAISCSHSPCN